MIDPIQSLAPHEQSSDRSFGFVMAGAFAVLAGILWWKQQDIPFIAGSLVVACAFLVLALARPAVLGPAKKVWLKFGELLHRIVSPVILGLMYFVVIVPIGLLMKLFGKDPLRLKLSPQAETYWIELEEHEAPSNMNQQF